MDAVEMPILGGVSVSKILSAKGFVGERVLVGGEAETRESATVVPVCGSSGSVATGFNTARSSNKEKSRVVRQKHGLDGKRGDKRTFKAPMKSKLDSFFSKNGLASSSSSSGGNNILGIYGLKSEIHVVTKHVDELSLNELLDGSYNCPSVCQDKGKKAASTNENIIDSVRKAYTMLKPQKTVPAQNSVDLDGAYDKKTETCVLYSGSGGTGRTDCDKWDAYNAEMKTSCCKDSQKPGAPASLDTSLLHEPKGILERLALQSGTDLDSILLDTTKPAVSSRHTPDLGAGKPIPRRDSLPSFSWSHAFTGPCKTNMDMGKLTNRATCQGRWVRIGSSASSYNGDSTTSYSDLDVFANDHDLLLSQQLKLGLSINDKTLSIPIRLPWYEQVSSSTMTCNLESQSSDKHILNGAAVMSSHYPLKPGLPNHSQDYFVNQLKNGFSMGTFISNPKVEDSERHQESDAISMSILPDNVRSQDHKDDCVKQEQWQRGKITFSTDSGSYSQFRCSISGCNKLQRHLHECRDSKQEEHSPRLLAAAQILHELASLSNLQNQINVKIRWPKKPSQKSMKARKSGSPLRKPEVTPLSPPKPVTGPNDHFKMPDRSAPSKKPRFFTNSQRMDIAQSQTNNIGKRPLKWSSNPTSSRSSPSRIEKGLVTDTKKLSADSLKYLGITQQSSSRVFDKTCNNTPQRLRKPLFIDWGRGRSKKEL